MEQAPKAVQPPLKSAMRRKSVFTEVGLVDEDTVRRERSPAATLAQDPSPVRYRPAQAVRFLSKEYILGKNVIEEEDDSTWETEDELEETGWGSLKNINLRPNENLNPMLFRIALFALALVLVLPALQISPLAAIGVRAGVIPTNMIELVKRDDTKPEVCKRWAHQSAIVNGTLYLYGGRSSQESDQKSNTWNNDFLTLDLQNSWQIASPAWKGLPKPGDDGPPKVALAYLWASHDSLFLYGGQFSEDPAEYPTAYSTWEYRIKDQKWIEHKDPKTSSGNHATKEGQPVQRSAEGAGFSVATLGRGWYFGGHLDMWTTEGWSNQVERVYLKSLLEFTFPGHSNNQVDDLKDGKTADEGGVYRNITEGGLQSTAGFPERADGLLVYIPGFADEGLLLGLTGGVNETFTQMNVIDVYDIATSTWYKQSTSGKTPKYRVNACAAVAAAADGSSYNVYMFGGQNLQPYKEQTQYDDMWILSVPSFTWIPVEYDAKQSVPYARAGHTCHIWDGQMISIGGYTDPQLSCDSPGIYVFNMSSLSWSDQFTALTGDRASRGYDGSENSGNPLAQQANQRGYDPKAGLEGSYGYMVPAAVQEVIGGKETGGATLTAPVQTPTEGPFQSGKPHTYTVTGPNGAIITEVTGGGGGGGSGTNIGAIVAGVVAGIFAVIAAYFAFCAWIYRKQVAMWKQHAAAAQARNEKAGLEGGAFGATGAMMTSSSGKDSSDRTTRDALFPPTGTDSGSGGGARTSGEAGPSTVGGGTIGGRNSIESSGSEGDDLLRDQEPSFWGTRGVLLNPRRSLRVINRD